MQEVLKRWQELWRWEVQWLAIRSWRWQPSAIIKADPLTTTWEVAKKLSVNHSMVIWHLKQIGKKKKLGKYVPHEPIQKKSCCLDVFSFLFFTSNHFLIGLWRARKNGLYRTTSDNQLLVDWEAPGQFSKQNLHQKEYHGHCLVVCCWSADYCFY